MLKIFNDTSYNYIFADFQWQEAVINLEKKEDWETYLKTFISSEKCCQSNHQDDQNAKN